MKFYLGKALRPYNTLALNASADAFVTVTSDVELLTALQWARERSLPVVPLGEGSNVVLTGRIPALVVHQKIRGIEVVESGSNSATVRVAAGENWHELVQWTLHRGYFGLENLALIPGTAGAAPIQNIGAYGVELQSVLSQVHARRVDDDGPIILDRAACEFGYRDSVFKHGLRDQLIITAIELQLALRPAVMTTYPALANYFRDNSVINPTPQAVFDAVVSIRRSKLPDPSREPNAGSFFKNPLLPNHVATRLGALYPELPIFRHGDGTMKASAAWMIDYCGWKGVRRDDLGVHEQHALVLVNYGSDNGDQLLSLADDIATSVYESFGVQLEIEPRLYGSRT